MVLTLDIGAESLLLCPKTEGLCYDYMLPGYAVVTPINLTLGVAGLLQFSGNNIGLTTVARLSIFLCKSFRYTGITSLLFAEKRCLRMGRN